MRESSTSHCAANKAQEIILQIQSQPFWSYDLIYPITLAYSLM